MITKYLHIISVVLVLLLFNHKVFSQNTGIGTRTPTHTLHIIPNLDEDPLRIEGLNVLQTVADSAVLVVDPALGVVRYILIDSLLSKNSVVNTDDQMLSLGGTTLSISNGNSVDLSTLNTDEQTLSINGNSLSISSGNSVDLSGISQNIFNSNGSLSEDRAFNIDGYIFQINGDGKKNSISLRRNSNANDIGISFQNGGNAYSAEIYSPRDGNGNDKGLDIATVGNYIDAESIGLSLRLTNEGKLVLPQYGSNTFSGTLSKYLGITSSGEVIEVNQSSLDDQTLSIVGNNLSIENGNSISLSDINLNMYNTNGSLSEDRDIDLREYSLRLNSDGKVNSFTFRRDDNANDIGMSFQNSGYAYPAAIYAPKSGVGNDNGLDFATVGIESDPSSLGLSLRLMDNGKLMLPRYGSGNFTGTASRLLAVSSSGDLIEIEPTSSDNQTLSVVGNTLSIENGNSVNLTDISQNVYNIDGALSEDRAFNIGSYTFQMNGAGKMNTMALRRSNNANDIGISFQNSGSAYPAVIYIPGNDEGNTNGLDFATVGNSTDPTSLGISLRLMNDGKLNLPQYGSGSFTGSASRYLAVSSNGDLIEVDQSSTDAQTLSISGNTLSIENGNSVNLSEASQTMYNANGTISEDRTVSVGGNTFKITGNGTKSTFALRRSNNANDIGISFQNSGNYFPATIFSPRSGSGNDNGLDFATVGTQEDPGSIGLTLRLMEDGKVMLPRYGSGTFSGSASRYLAVNSSGELIEVDQSSSDAQTLSISGNTLSIENGNSVNLSQASQTIYNVNGSISEDRTVSVGGNTFKINGSGTKKTVALRRNNNANDIGISFQNGGNYYPAAIFSPKSGSGNDNGLDFATVGTQEDPESIGLTLRLMEDGKVMLPRYGSGTFSGTASRYLAVSSSGDIIEVDQSSSDAQTLSLSGNTLSIENGNSVNLSEASQTIYNADGSLSENRAFNIGGHTLQINANGKDHSFVLRRTNNANDIGMAFQNSGNAYPATMFIPENGGGNDNGLDFATVGNQTDPSALNLSLRITNQGQLIAPQYGTGTFSGSASRLLAVSSSGNIIEINPSDTDEQTLSISGSNLSISNGNSVSLSGISDDMGDHIAKTNLQLNDKWLSNDGGNEGLQISNNGSLTFLGGGISMEGGLKNSNQGIEWRFSGNNDRYGMAQTTGSTLQFYTSGTAGSANFKWSLANNSGDFDHLMMLKKNGNLGIGTTDPRATLHVQGSTRITDLSGTGNRMVISDQFGNLSTQNLPSDTDNQNLSLTGNNLTIENGNTVSLTTINTDEQTLTLVGNNLFISGGNSVSLETISDNLGNHMATTDLDMNSNELDFGNITGQKINLFGTSYGIGVQASTQYFRTGNNFGWYRGGSHDDDELDAGGGTSLMELDRSGNLGVKEHLGVGTFSPSRELHVVKNAHESLNGTVGNALFLLENDGESGMSIISSEERSSFITFGDNTDSRKGSINFQTNNKIFRFRIDGDNKMVLDSLGRVGIGVNSPSADLHVEGTARIADLSGSGSRLVVADGQGNLSTQSLPSDTDDQNLSLSGTTLSIENGNTVNLSSLNENIFNSDGDLTGDRAIDLDDYDLQLNTNDSRSALTLRRTDNSNEMGLSFRNSGNAYPASILVPGTGSDNIDGLDFATRGNQSEPGNLGVTLRLTDQGKVIFSTYGSGNNTGTLSEYLGVTASGELIEIDASTVNQNIFNSDGTISDNRALNLGTNHLQMNSSGIRNGFTIRRTNNSNDLGLAFRNSGDAYPAAIMLPKGNVGNNNGLDFATIGNETEVDSLGISFRLTDQGKAILPEYGTGRFTGNPSGYLSVNSAGEIIEVEQSDINTDDQRLTFNGSSLSIEGGNSVNLSVLSDDLGDHQATMDLDMDDHIIDFGSEEQQMINLRGSNYGIGVQPNTQYFRTLNHFAWYRRGAHYDSTLHAGSGGETLMTLKNNGHLSIENRAGIGTFSPQRELHVVKNAHTSMANPDGNSLLVLENNGSSGMNIIGSNSGTTFIEFGDDTDVDRAAISYRASDKLFRFQVNNSARMIIDSLGQVGIGTNNPNQLLSVNGDAGKTGSSTWATFSDRRMKKNVNDFKDGLELVRDIRPVTFEYNGKGGYESDGKSYVGIIAQEMEKIAPYMVSKVASEDFEDQRVYDANALTYILVNALKELDQKVEQLEEENSQLKAMNTELREEQQNLTEKYEALSRDIASFSEQMNSLKKLQEELEASKAQAASSQLTTNK